MVAPFVFVNAAQQNAILVHIAFQIMVTESQVRQVSERIIVQFNPHCNYAFLTVLVALQSTFDLIEIVYFLIDRSELLY